MKNQILKIIQLLVCVSFLTSNVFADGMPEGSEKASTISSDKGVGVKVVADVKAEVKEDSKRPSLSDKDLLAYQYCGKDSDCMPVINGCCQCMQGDKYVAINKDRLEAFQARFSCEGILCPKEESFSYSCEEGVVSCVNHRCLYVAPGGQ